MDFRRAIVILLCAALGLPMLLAMLAGLAALLDALKDEGGAVVLWRLALAVGIMWAASLIALVVLLALRSLGRDETGEE